MYHQPDVRIDGARSSGPITRAVICALKMIAAFGMFLMMAITFLDALGRYFMMPIFGAPEMIQFLLALTIFAGMGIAAATQAHITVDIFSARLQRRFGRGFDLMTRSVNTAGMILIAWQLARLALEAGQKSRMSIVLEWPLVWVIGLAALLAAGAVWTEISGHYEAAGSSAADGEENP